MKRLLLLLPLLLALETLQAQYLGGIATRWNDSFTEWVLLDENGEPAGELKLRWPFQNDWSEWDFEFGETFGSIRRKWRDNPNEWELRCDNRIYTARTVWPDNPREWRITDNRLSLTFRTTWGNVWDEWETRQSPHGSFELFTQYEGDPRDWVIADHLDEQVPLPMKILMTFIAVFHSSPKQ